MTISKIIILPTKRCHLTRIKAFANIIIDGDIAINGIKIIERDENDILIVFPEFTNRDGTKYGYVVPLRTDVRNELTAAIIKEYKLQRKTKGEDYEV